MSTDQHNETLLRRVWNAAGIGWKIVVGIGVILGLLTGVFALEDRAARQTEKVRAQAKLVSASIQMNSRGQDAIKLSNDSSRPVSRVIVTLVPINAEGMQIVGARTQQTRPGQHDTFEQLPAGHWWDRNLMPSDAMGGVRPAVELAFTDENGRHWLRSASGHLRQLSERPEDYYRLPAPQTWWRPADHAP